jgi:hypothetical protein
MTKTEVQAVRRAISILGSQIDVPVECAPVPRQSPVRRFVEDYLVADPNADLSCDEIWKFFQEVVAAGELSPMRKAVFLRQLPILMQEAVQARKSHHIWREGRWPDERLELRFFSYALN